MRYIQIFDDDEDVCSTCGLSIADGLCICEEVAKTETRLKVVLERRKWGKVYTLIKGLDPKEFDLKDLATTLKSKLACGGSYKDGAIELQGDHSFKIIPMLEKMGFDADAIDIVRK